MTNGADDINLGRIGFLRRRGVLARSGHLEYDRVLFFTDAVFAIAITLLVVDLPAHLRRGPHHGNVLINWPGIIGFAISFVVIGLFWMAHHSLFRYITAFDGTLLRLNLLFIGTIAFLPYPTAVLSAAKSTQRSAVVFYAACAGSAGLVEAVIWLWACRSGLVSGIGSRAQQLLLLRTWLTPAVFAVSIVVTLLSSRAAIYVWLVIWAGDWLLNRAYGRGQKDEPAGDAGSGDPPVAPRAPG